jgi:hypothetical protein
MYTEKIEKEGPDAVRRSLRGGNYRPGGMRRQQRRSTNAHWQIASTKHQLSIVADS